ncbi:MAG: zinc-binding dehydrogenase [Pseudomonadales bacterium]|nr:zinc-binding dehydrogenase [Pseudomonadales bacterium]MDG1443499.1 zinc-binding dehydrogenase [Pseudomonadales bacterium]
MREMKAVIASPDGPLLRDVPLPQPRPNEVLVKVSAAALNRADLGMLKGAAHGSAGGAGSPLGLEFAGEVAEVGSEVTKWQVGDRVMAAGGNAFAEYAVGHCDRILAVPSNLSIQQATTFPVGLQTEHDAIKTHGQLTQGQTILIQGASSGVGLLAMQVAKFLGAGLVIGTSTNADRRGELKNYGADLSVNTKDSDWVQQVLAATGGKGVDVLIDHVSGSTANDNMLATKVGGRIVNVGRLGGMTGEFNFDLHALRRIAYVGVTFRTRNAREVERIVEATSHDLLPGLASDVFKLPIHQVFPLEQVNDAFALMIRNEHFGKIVLSI